MEQRTNTIVSQGRHGARTQHQSQSLYGAKAKMKQGINTRVSQGKFGSWTQNQHQGRHGTSNQTRIKQKCSCGDISVPSPCFTKLLDALLPLLNHIYTSPGRTTPVVPGRIATSKIISCWFGTTNRHINPCRITKNRCIPPPPPHCNVTTISR